MKITKRLFSFLLALTLVIGVMVIAPVTASALDNGTFTYRVLEDDTVEITGLVSWKDLETAFIDIPDEIDDKTVVGIADNAFADDQDHNTDFVSLPEELRYIGASAFYGVEIVENLHIPASVTTIGDKAFGFGSDSDKQYVWQVFGDAGSAAETYCKNNGLKFIDNATLNHEDYHSEIRLRKLLDNGEYDYDNTKTVLMNLEVGELPEGLSFDKDTFTLSLNGFDHPEYELVINRICAKPVTLSVSGDNYLGHIMLVVGMDMPQLKIVGDGTLTVNQDKQYDEAIRLSRYYASEVSTETALEFGNDVGLALYGKTAAAKILPAGTSEGGLRTSPIKTADGAEIKTTKTRNSYVRNLSESGYLSTEYIPDHAYSYQLGYKTINKNDPDGQYVLVDDYDWDTDTYSSVIYPYVYDKAHDIYVIDYSDPRTYDDSVYDAYDDNDEMTELMTKEYDTSQYLLVRAMDGNDYLIESYQYGDIEDCTSMSVIGYQFDRLDEKLLSKYGDPYAVIGEGDWIELSGGLSDEGAAETLGEITGIVFPSDPILGYLATPKADDGYAYTYQYYTEEVGEPDDYVNVYSVNRYYYSKALDYYIRDYDFYVDEMPEAIFLQSYAPVFDNGERVEVKNSKEYEIRWDMDVYTDADGNRYVCDTDYNKTTQERVITAVYRMQEADDLLSESTTYLFTPAEDVDRSGLTALTETVYLNDYTYTLSQTEYFYNLPDYIKTIDTLDVGNLWTYQYISSNPDCSPCYVPFIGEVNPDIEGAYVDDEIWTNTTDKTFSSKKMPAALKPGYAYAYTMIVKAEPGYVFSDDLSFTYLREACPNAKLTLSSDKRTLTIEGLEKVTFLLDTPKLAGVANVYGGVQVKWNAVKGAAKYRVFRKDAKTSWKKVGDTTALSFTDKTPASGTKYTYTVRCISADGKIMASGYDTTGMAITHFGSPVISKLENVNTGTKITWKAVKGATYYRVLVKSGKTWKSLGDTKSTSFIVKKRASGTKYTYTVRPMNAKKQYIGAYNTSGWAATFIAAPALPKLTNTKNGVQVTYTKPKGGTYFRIMRKTGKGKWVKIADTNKTKIVDKTAKKGVKYTYTVRCIAKGGKTFLSGYNTTGRTITCKR